MNKQMHPEIILVGSGYHQSFQDISYCSESVNGDYCSASPSLETMARFLRKDLRIKPSQIDNIGTGRPFQTTSLSERKFRELESFLSRPLALAILSEKEYSHKRSVLDKYKIDILGWKDELRLLDIPEILNHYEFGFDDISFKKPNSSNTALLPDLFGLKYTVSRLKTI